MSPSPPVRRRALAAGLAAAVALALAACGGDDDGGDETASEATAPPAETAPAPAETGTATAETAPAAPGGEPPFSPTYVFSGDELIACAKERDVEVAREPEAPEVDPVENGIVHDRLTVGPPRDPVLRVRMFGSADLAREQGALVAGEFPGTETLGTVVLEPHGDAAAEREVVLECLKEQAAG
jgi:hypothetical protein